MDICHFEKAEFLIVRTQLLDSIQKMIMASRRKTTFENNRPGHYQGTWLDTRTRILGQLVVIVLLKYARIPLAIGKTQNTLDERKAFFKYVISVLQPCLEEKKMKKIVEKIQNTEIYSSNDDLKHQWIEETVLNMQVFQLVNQRCRYRRFESRELILTLISLEIILQNHMNMKNNEYECLF